MQSSNRKYKGRTRNWKKPPSPEREIASSSKQEEYPILQVEQPSVVDYEFGKYAPIQDYELPKERDEEEVPIQYSRKAWRKTEQSLDDEAILSADAELVADQEQELQQMLRELAQEVEGAEKAQGRKLMILVSVFAVLTLFPLVFIHFTHKSIETELNSVSSTISSSSQIKTTSKTTTSTSKSVTTEVPNVSDLTLEAAKLKLEKAGFVVGTVNQEQTANKPEGIVLRTNPQAGSKKAKGETIHIIVTSQTLPSISNLVGETSEEAAEILRSMGATVEIKLENSQQVPRGSVIKSDPPEGTKIEKGSKVTLYVSNGSPQKSVPNLVGQSEDTAKQLLQGEGLAVGATNREYHSSIEAGKVISMDPPVGTRLEEGAVVDLIISKGRELVMPDLSSGQLTYVQARNQLQALGVDLNMVEKVEDRSYVSTTSDLVVGQYPSAGSTIDGTITLYVSVASTTTSSSTLSSSTQSSSMHSEEGR